jgi:two-component system response regulator AtoC
MRGDVLTKKRQGEAAPGCWLLVFWEGGSQEHQLLPEARLVLGRADDSDVCVPHESVSRRHAVLTGSDGIWSIEDLGSSNGTFVAGARLASGTPRTIKPGAVVMLGDARLVLDVRGVSPSAPQDPAAPALVGEAMRRAMRLVDLVADSVLPVLLLGETGVGKGRLAELIHRRSSRASSPFVRLNCAAVPESLLESELLGYERGAFTGAVRAKPGIIEAADHGTVFLDEIGEIPRSTQVKLLHVLEHNEVMRVGAVKPRPIDVRFLAATNCDLESLVAQGTFRRDLYFRLAGVPLRIPSLRERTDEIPAMARAFIEEACARPRRAPPTISHEAMARLVAHSWPGNIRELRNVVMRAALLCAGPVVLPEHLMLDSAEATADHPAVTATPGGLTLPPPPAPPDDDAHQGKAAQYLGVSRRTLTNRLTELALPRPRKDKRKGDGGA